MIKKKFEEDVEMIKKKFDKKEKTPNDRESKRR